MRLETPWALALMALLPLWWWLRRRMARSPAVRFPSLTLLGGTGATWRTRLGALPQALRFASLGLLIVALARPQYGIGRVQTSTEAVAIQVVVDRSGSMSTEMLMDGKPSSRLAVVKQVLREFLLGNGAGGGTLHGRTQDVVGLISFARYAETICPLVRDPEALVALADDIRLAQGRAEDGTAIGDAVALAAARLQHAEQDLRTRSGEDGAAGGSGVNTAPPPLTIKSKVIVLLTDGDNNCGDREPLEAAALAAQWGVKIYTIAIGAGTTFQTVHSPIFGDQRFAVPGADTRTLEQIARASGGAAFLAGDAEAMRKIYEQIDRLEKTNVQTVKYTDYQERFMPWAVAGAAALAMEVLLATTALRRSP